MNKLVRLLVYTASFAIFVIFTYNAFFSARHIGSAPFSFYFREEFQYYSLSQGIFYSIALYLVFSILEKIFQKPSVTVKTK